MKIDGQTGNELLQRMQEAHEANYDGVAGAAPSGAKFSVAGASEARPVAEPSELQAKIEVTASRALSGEFADAESIRAAVVEDIVRDRWETKLPRRKLQTMIGDLKSTLASDPEFSRQVDSMLLLAARSLGGRDR